MELTIDEVGTGRPVLLLHGGAGQASVLPFASHLAAQRSARVLLPTHPGFNGTPLDQAGHLPQIEAPDATLAAIWDFADQHSTARSTH